MYPGDPKETPAGEISEPGILGNSDNFPKSLAICGSRSLCPPPWEHRKCKKLGRQHTPELEGPNRRRKMWKILPEQMMFKCIGVRSLRWTPNFRAGPRPVLSLWDFLGHVRIRDDFPLCLRTTPYHIDFLKIWFFGVARHRP